MRLAALVIPALVAAGPGRAEALLTSLSTRTVSITSTYTGARIVVFGVIERDANSVSRVGPYDIVVTARGPRRTTIVREKERIGPIWVNRAQRRFVDLPAFLAVLSTRPVEDIAESPLRQRFGIGLEAIVTPAGLDIDADSPKTRFRDALLRLRAADSLFVERPRGVAFLSPAVFQGAIALPATAPTGAYDVDIALFVGGAMIARQHKPFEVVKTGFEQAVVKAARERPLLYGLTAAAGSVLLGWLASLVFRRD